MSRRSGILVRNVYCMLAYAFQALRQKRWEDLGAENFEHVHDLFATILARGMARQLKQGIYREYVPAEAELAGLRGRIDMRRSMLSRLAGRRTLACAFDELSEDNLLNRILKTAALLLLRHGRVHASRKQRLLQVLPGYAYAGTIDPSQVQWPSGRFQRGAAECRMLAGLCRLLFDGMLLTTEQGELRLASFLDGQQMCRLFEKFILEYYSQERPCGVSASSPWIAWALDGGQARGLPAMLTDVALEKDGRCLVIDAKYYGSVFQSRGAQSTFHSANLYQIFAYVKNMAAAKGPSATVSGMLLYAATGERVPPSSYQMSGNRIGVRTLDLNRPFEEIKAQLDGIASEHFAG